jgi:glutathione S-transferase
VVAVNKADNLRREYEGAEFHRFGWAETVFTSFFRRFAMVSWFDEVDLPETPEFARVRAWREACLAHPAAQQVGDEEIIKSYYDYSRGAGNGALLPGRSRSSFVFEPHWSTRPMPPRGKSGPALTDAELGLVG